VFCALHDQLASLCRHAQLTRCFSAVAELLVTVVTQIHGDSRKSRHTTKITAKACDREHVIILQR